MRKYTLLFMISIITESIMGQSMVGVKGGEAFLTIYDKYNQYHIFHNGSSYIAGLDFWQSKSRIFNWGISLNYRSETFDMAGGYGGLGSWEEISTHFNLEYLSISGYPVLNSPEWNRLKLFVYAGPCFDYIVKSRKNGFRTYKGVTSMDTGSVLGDFKPYDIELKAGIGIIFRINKCLGFYLDSSFDHSIAEITKGRMGNSFSIRTKGFSIAAGVLYNLNHPFVK